MGQLIEGDPLPHDKMREVLAYIRLHGALQFLNIWKRMKGIENDELKFGDEIECGIFEVDGEKKTVKLSCRGAEINYQLNGLEEVYSHESEGCNWHAEWGAWMVESTPSRPYSHFANEMLRIERNMVVRRRRLLSALKENEIAPTVTCFPLMGVGDFIADAQPFASPHSQSIYVPDYVINPHPRFATLVRNIRERRGKKVDIRVPLYRDINTPEFSVSGKDYPFPAGYFLEEGHEIHMDCMAFGMGMCCLQVTFQAKDVDESRYMYDQLAVLAPIMLALTAATPIFKGRLSDIDARWTVISQSVDDRRDAEKGLLSEEDRLKASDTQLAGDGIRLIPKSRYDSISTYIYHCEGDAPCARTFEEYNDISCPIDENVYQLLKEQGVDENLAHHVAHLFIRDAIVAYEGKIELNDEETTDHFECIQSTNWQSCRWKPPPFQHAIDHSTEKTKQENEDGKENEYQHHIGWRTEFRSMEVQLTDFENAAFTVFILLITRVMLAFDLGFYIPISKVDENMKRAHIRNAVLTQKFFFRKHIAPPAINLGSIDEVDHPNNNHDNNNNNSNQSNKSLKFCCDGKNETGSSKTDGEYEEMTMTEIFLGKENYYPGLLPLVYAYLDFINCDSVTSQRVHEYLQFIEKRVTGELVTPATYIRRFVVSHPEYKNDSIVTPSIAHDLLLACQQIGDGTRLCPELLGEIRIPKIRKEDAYGKVLAGKLSSQDRSQLIQTLIERAKIPRSSKVPRGRLRGLSESSTAHSSGPGSPKRGGRSESKDKQSL